MLKRMVAVSVFCSFAGFFISFAQESVSSDSLLRDRKKVTAPLLHDSLQLQQTTPVFPLPSIRETESPLRQQPIRNDLESSVNDTVNETGLLWPSEFKPAAFFNLGASRWNVPLIGAVTTFSPAITYRATKDLSFFGGVGFSQFHNLSYVQSIVAPGLPARSNIISNGFIGASYSLYDRIILHGLYQRSLYNQLPRNMIMFAPGQNTVIAGASFDIWNGLGVTVDHVWEFDRYGHIRKGFRYSPYIDVNKFIKFLKQ